MSHARAGKRSGDPAAQPARLPVVMLPGLLTTPEIWGEVMNAMAGAPEWRCLPTACPPLDTVEAIADAIAGELVGEFHLVGFSFGGYVSLAMLDRYPERLASLTLVGSASHADNDATLAFRQQCLDAVAAGTVEALAAQLTARAMQGARAANDPLFMRALRMAADYGVDRFAAHTRACMARPDRTEVLGSAQIQRRFVSGESDATVPLGLQRRSAEACGATLHLVPQAAHLVPLEQPRRLGKILLGFLAETEADDRS